LTINFSKKVERPSDKIFHFRKYLKDPNRFGTASGQHGMSCINPLGHVRLVSCRTSPTPAICYFQTETGDIEQKLYRHAVNKNGPRPTTGIRHSLNGGLAIPLSANRVNRERPGT
jgi:hypothetical protein